ncbi:MAG TPA: SDR family oxidoreductase [Gemmatimonadales bacterium]
MIFREDLLSGQVAFITGGGTGIGFGIAESFARCGATVVIASRKPRHVDPAVERLTEAGGQAMAVALDVRDPEAVARVVRDVVDIHGRVDVLVNNAAGNFYAPSAELSVNGWRAVIETDLYGTFYCSQAVYPLMQRQGGGRIVSVSMTLHYRGWPRMAHATAAKAGVDALTRTLALEWAPDRITVNAIAPGPIPTEGVLKAFGGDAARPALDEAMKNQIPLGRWGTPEDIGQMAVYLASPAAAWITGAIFVVDGGSWLART